MCIKSKVDYKIPMLVLGYRSCGLCSTLNIFKNIMYATFTLYCEQTFFACGFWGVHFQMSATLGLQIFTVNSN